jgi:hypothetical protein
LPYSQYIQDYKTPAGVLRIEINYWSPPIHSGGPPPESFNGKVIEVSKLKRGYEDDDNLTFAPGVLTLGFTDYDKYNFYLLKNAFNTTPTTFNDGWGYKKSHSVKLFLNGQQKFYGYIDKQSLEYENETKTTRFDVIDFAIDLKNITIEGAPPAWHVGIHYIGVIFKKVYKDLNINDATTNNLAVFEGSFNGKYLYHDWVFDSFGSPGPLITRSFDMNIDPTGHEGVHIYAEWIQKAAENYYDVLKNIALELGVIIGVSDYNKIYINKRFSTPSSIFYELLNPNLIDYTSSIHLRNVVGSRININKEGNVYSAIGGNFETIGDINSKAKYPDAVIEQKGFNTEFAPPHNEGAASYRVSQGGNVGYVLNGVTDPVLNERHYPHWLLAKWLYLSRKNVKEKIDAELTGINYYMHRYYKVQDKHKTLYFRPLQIEQDFLENKTNMIALEI